MQKHWSSARHLTDAPNLNRRPEPHCCFQELQLSSNPHPELGASLQSSSEKSRWGWKRRSGTEPDAVCLVAHSRSPREEGSFCAVPFILHERQERCCWESCGVLEEGESQLTGITWLGCYRVMVAIATPQERSGGRCAELALRTGWMPLLPTGSPASHPLAWLHWALFLGGSLWRWKRESEGMTKMERPALVLGYSVSKSTL